MTTDGDVTTHCPTCGAANQRVGKFCDQCGSKVEAAPDAVTATISDGNTPPDGAVSNEPASQDPAPSAEAGHARLRFVRLLNGTFKAEHAFDVPVGATLLVGRTDPTSGIFPDVDVTMWAQRVPTSQGDLYTIHRKQCLIRRDDEARLWIIDAEGYEGDTLVAPVGTNQFQTIPSLSDERAQADDGSRALVVGDRILMGQGAGMLIFQLVSLDEGATTDE
ncbi:MAG: zinc ribbon domain-containing protein [Ardenticatenales bacterium]|nr:zinc ribbon domain-containing protein [Ardenticatenales bacterium]